MNQKSHENIVGHEKGRERKDRKEKAKAEGEERSTKKTEEAANRRQE